MTRWNETQEAADFIAKAYNVNTSPEIMEAIAFFSHNLAEAVALWGGDGFDVVCSTVDLWEHVTRNGLRPDTDFHWGAAGRGWYAAITA